MTDEEKEKLNQLMQYAQMGAAAPGPAPGWGTFPVQNPIPVTVSSDLAVTPVNPVVQS